MVPHLVLAFVVSDGFKGSFGDGFLGVITSAFLGVGRGKQNFEEN